MAQGHCVLETVGYRHTLRICSTATMATRTPLNATSYAIPSLLPSVISVSLIYIHTAHISRTVSRHSGFVRLLKLSDI